MKQPALQPVDRCARPRAGSRSSPAGEHRGWLGRLGSNVVERKLDPALQGLVRHEKYASALIISLRIARELEAPLGNLERRIAALDRLAEREPEIRRLAAGLRRDRRAILRVIDRLARLQPPSGIAA